MGQKQVNLGQNQLRNVGRPVGLSLEPWDQKSPRKHVVQPSASRAQETNDLIKVTQAGPRQNPGL